MASDFLRFAQECLDMTEGERLSMQAALVSLAETFIQAADQCSEALAPSHRSQLNKPTLPRTMDGSRPMVRRPDRAPFA